MRAVRISYDPAKNQRNIRERRLSFESAAEFEFESALYAIDERQDYGENAISLSACLEFGCMSFALPRRRKESASSAFAKPTHGR